MTTALPERFILESGLLKSHRRGCLPWTGRPSLSLCEPGAPTRPMNPGPRHPLPLCPHPGGTQPGGSSRDPEHGGLTAGARGASRKQLGGCLAFTPRAGATRSLGRGQQPEPLRPRKPSLLTFSTPAPLGRGVGARPSQEGHSTDVPGSWVAWPAPPGNTPESEELQPQARLRETFRGETAAGLMLAWASDCHPPRQGPSRQPGPAARGCPGRADEDRPADPRAGSRPGHRHPEPRG